MINRVLHHLVGVLLVWVIAAIIVFIAIKGAVVAIFAQERGFLILESISSLQKKANDRKEEVVPISGDPGAG